jgi:hypothetical protein
MKRALAIVIVLAFALAFGHPDAQAQSKKAGRYMVSLYNVATGKHLQFLKWMAEREAVAKEAGAPPIQWYVHQNGAGWDFIAMSEVGDPAKEAEMDKKTDEIAKKKGLTTGMAASLEFRQYIGSHSDTYAGGPYTAEELVKEAEKR